MAFRNPEQAFMLEHTNQEQPLSSREEAIGAELYRLRRLERQPEKLSLREMMAQRSPASDAYSTKEIEQDSIWAGQDKRTDVIENTERANLLQDIMVRDGAAFGWFGNPQTTRITGTTGYDDRQNFVDAVVTSQRKDGTASHLAIDLVAARADSGSISKKRTGIERKIINGRHARVKYLPELGPDKKVIIRRVEQLPQIIIGLSPSSLTELSEKLYAYYCPEPALREFRDKRGIKAYNKENPQNPQAMKEYARQQIANHPIAYEIAQEAFAQLESQALLALNVFLDRTNTLLHEERPELEPYLEKIKGLENAIAEFRAHLNADPTQVARDETVAALERAFRMLPEYQALEKATGYPVREVIKPLLPFVKFFGNLATKRQALADPEKEDPTVRHLTRPWESDQMTRRQLAAAA